MVDGGEGGMGRGKGQNTYSNEMEECTCKKYKVEEKLVYIYMVKSVLEMTRKISRK